MRLTCHEFITKTHPALNEEVLPTTQHIFSQPGFALSAVSKQSSDRGQLPVGRPMYVAAATPSSLARHITMWTSAWRRVSISKFEAALRQAAIGQLWGSDRGSNIRVCVCVCVRARAQAGITLRNEQTYSTKLPTQWQPNTTQNSYTFQKSSKWRAENHLNRSSNRKRHFQPKQEILTKYTTIVCYRLCAWKNRKFSNYRSTNSRVADVMPLPIFIT